MGLLRDQHELWRVAHIIKDLKQIVIPKVIKRSDGATRRRYTFKQRFTTKFRSI